MSRDWWWEFDQAKRHSHATVYCTYCKRHIGEVPHAFRDGEKWVQHEWRPFRTKHELEPEHRYNELLARLAGD